MREATYIVLLLCACLLASGLHAQDARLVTLAGARNASLVNSNIAEATDVSVMYENPAALSFVENGGMLLNHAQASSWGGMSENIAFPLLLESPVAVALGLDADHRGYVGTTPPDGQRMLLYGYDIALAGEITPTLSIGASAAIRHDAITGGSTAWGATFSAGFDYAPTPDVSYGLVYGGVGREIAILADNSATVSNGMPRKTLEAGATMTYPSSASLRSPILVLSFANEKIFGVKGIYYKGGIEIRPVEFVQLRFGYLAGPGLYAAAYGIGFPGDLVSLQYAAYPEHGSKIFHQQVSISAEM